MKKRRDAEMSYSQKRITKDMQKACQYRMQLIDLLKRIDVTSPWRLHKAFGGLAGYLDAGLHKYIGGLAG